MTHRPSAADHAKLRALFPVNGHVTRQMVEASELRDELASLASRDRASTSQPCQRCDSCREWSAPCTITPRPVCKWCGAPWQPAAIRTMPPG